MSIRTDLEAMRIDPKGAALFHTSMKAIGPCFGGPDDVLHGLMDYFGDGVMAFPALSFEICYQRERVFDVEKTPSCIGLLPERFRLMPGVGRSIHPTHSVCAYGALAAAFLEGHEYTDTPCGRNSPWGRLVELDADILMVGCDLRHCTFLHGVEEWAVPGLHLGPLLDFTLLVPGRPPRTMWSRPHFGSPSLQFDRVEGALEEGGALRRGKLGNAMVLVVNAVAANRIVGSMLRDNPRFFDSEAVR